MINPPGRLRCAGTVTRSPLKMGKEALKMEIVQPRANLALVKTEESEKVALGISILGIF